MWKSESCEVELNADKGKNKKKVHFHSLVKSGQLLCAPGKAACVHMPGCMFCKISEGKAEISRGVDVDWDSVQSFSTPQVHKHPVFQKQGHKSIWDSDRTVWCFGSSLETCPHIHSPHYTCRVMMLKTGDWSKSLWFNSLIHLCLY